MNNEKIQEHAFKEFLKNIVKSSPVYPNNVKDDLMAIIDLGKNPEEICEKTLIYFSKYNR